MNLSGLFVHKNIFDRILFPFSDPPNINMFLFFNLLGRSVFVFSVPSLYFSSVLSYFSLPQYFQVYFNKCVALQTIQL